MTIDKDVEVETFLGEIKQRFPEVANRIELNNNRMGYEPDDKMYTAEMETFSQTTTDAIKAGDHDRALNYLKYMSEKLLVASVIEREYIDVYYVESLLWDIKDKKIKQAGWLLIPSNLKQLYIEMWGNPSF
ncbi:MULTISPECIES: hypothetical protein [unclassified Pseudoalteromonas]|uniref:DUF7674 family protein n=1 Tax=unclassified Pseudoalteromonas TaxID=194690 RepID=UPI0033347BCF